MDIITLEDCLINFEVNNKITILNDGRVIGFEEETSLFSFAPYILIWNE